MSLIPAKCDVMTLGRCEIDPPNYIEGGKLFQRVESHTDLGINLDRSFTLQGHICQLCKSAYCALYLMKRIILPSTTIEVKKKLYLMLVGSRITYRLQNWRRNTYR